MDLKTQRELCVHRLAQVLRDKNDLARVARNLARAVPGSKKAITAERQLAVIKPRLERSTKLGLEHPVCEFCIERAKNAKPAIERGPRTPAAPKVKWEPNQVQIEEMKRLPRDGSSIRLTGIGPIPTRHLLALKKEGLVGGETVGKTRLPGKPSPVLVQEFWLTQAGVDFMADFEKGDS
jgi:hypothetical protein